MKRLLFFFVHFLLVSVTLAHEEPTSFVDVRGETITLTASAVDLAHELPNVQASMLMHQETLLQNKIALEKQVQEGFQLAAQGKPLAMNLVTLASNPEKQDVILTFQCSPLSTADAVTLTSRLFPYDTRHRTFVNIYNGETVLRQLVFDANHTTSEFLLPAAQGLWSIITEFIGQGIHHIFIGADHILFIIGLLLLGGTWQMLLKITTTFTIAHSITLALATFRILTPPAEIVEPIIALSIVFVGLDAFLFKTKRDPRLLFAFGFGLIHGFGFAGVLQEMSLPTQALGWSLFSFNLGVEIGQLAIVATAAPLLAWLHIKQPTVARHVVSGLALAVTAAGGYWFFERVMAA